MDARSLSAVVGARVRAERHGRGLALGALASRAGVGKGSLSEIENGVRNPTLATLYALAAALEVPLATLLAERPGAVVESPGIAARLLDVTRGAHAVAETYRLDLTPGEVHRSGAHGTGVRETLVVVSGRLRAGRRGALMVAAAGETLGWVSDAPHSYEALDGPASAVLVVLTPAQ